VYKRQDWFRRMAVSVRTISGFWRITDCRWRSWAPRFSGLPIWRHLSEDCIRSVKGN